MDAPQPSSALEIEVADFGPIVHAKVDLRPMTVFIGPSNTGKSYLATLIYALHRVFSGSSTGFRLWQQAGPRQFRRGGLPPPHLSPEIGADFDRLKQEVINSMETGSILLPDGIIELLRNEFDSLYGALTAEILRCFGQDELAELSRKGRNACPRLDIRRSLPGDVAPLQHTFAFDAPKLNLKTSMPQRIPVGDDARNDFYFDLETACLAVTQSDDIAGAYFELQLAVDHLMGLVAATIMGSLHSPAYYLPSDRTGAMHAHGAIVSAMLGYHSVTGMRSPATTPLLPAVMADFLGQLLANDRVRDQRRPDEYDAGAEIEKLILQGTVSANRLELINYPHFTYRPDGWKDDLPLLNASSMVSDVAPLVLYLRHIVQPGNVLIIEEPESHLHPAMQVEFTRQLAKLVQAGYRVIITTHSEWVLEELGNVVQRSRLPAQERATIPNGEVALTADQVGVWLFRPNPRGRARGSEVVPVPLGDAGLYDAGFDDVAIALSNDGAKIFNQIGESR